MGLGLGLIPKKFGFHGFGYGFGSNTHTQTQNPWFFEFYCLFKMEKIMETQGLIASCMSQLPASRRLVEVKEEKKESKHYKIFHYGEWFLIENLRKNNIKLYYYMLNLIW